MREIKFRAWDAIGRNMFQINSLRTEYSNESDLRFAVDGVRFPIMQYIGLKDKNGKEIYEGDIWIGKYYCGNNPQELKAICVMKWDDAHAQFYWEDIIFGMPDFIKPEVVGNIYENPELLKPVSKEAER
ncbi:MAG: YopX family protein [Eubacteriales bacterium]|jgi:hypothetical protein